MAVVEAIGGGGAEVAAAEAIGGDGSGKKLEAAAAETIGGVVGRNPNMAGFPDPSGNGRVGHPAFPTLLKP